ncbi:MAG: Nif3-like dinuclear metal center hexameric protein [Ruminococcaceae bacterium]|nr:Nif3-like dinuclear metal center hexameric protein [Oscillospiraceae bacterium]
MSTVKDIYSFLDTFAPFSSAAPWDNTGLSVGDLNKEVKKVMLSLDVTKEVIDEAIKENVDLVVTHHPLIFEGVKSVTANSLLYKAVSSGIAFISSHTSLDIAKNGVNDCLAKAVGIKNITSIEEEPFLKFGETEEKTEEEFVSLLKEKLNCNVLYNSAGNNIKKIAFCSGAGGDLFNLAKEKGADALLTGEAKYHEFLDAAFNNITIFACGHFETEIVVIDTLKEKLEKEFPDIEFLKANQKNIISCR